MQRQSALPEDRAVQNCGDANHARLWRWSYGPSG